MKKLYLLIFILFSSQLYSQYYSSGIGRWKLGLNIGGLCQRADVKHDVYNFGFGATLEYAAYQKQSSFFGFSLRGRFLNGKTTGYSSLPHNGVISNNAINGTIDSSFNYSNSLLYQNNRTKLNEFSLEAMLKWNKLYINHGILFYLYLGGGFTNYLVETDQKDAFGTPYNYSLLSSSPTIDEIKTLQDGEFETELENSSYNSMVFTPSFGVGLGFRIVPGLDFAIEHKTSLPQTDLWDGQQIDDASPAFIEDYYNYTSLGLIFSIVGSVEPEVYTPPVEPIEPDPIPPTDPIAPKKPIITLTKPVVNSFNSPNCKVDIEAKIEHVTKQSDIQFFHNNKPVPSYKYFFTAPIFKCKIELEEGNNNFKIITANAGLSSSKTFSLTCNNQKTIAICHKNADGTSTNLTINESEWTNHAAHGDFKGNCPEKQITICHNIPGQGGKTQTISIPESQWSVHKSHGDYLGECSVKTMIKICHNNQEITIDEKDWATHAAHGDTKGDCPPPQVNMITICHVPTTGDKRITMAIPESEWLVHQAHGDYKGTCPQTEPTTTICHKNNDGTKSTITIPEFKWNEHFSHGDSKGACPENTFIICHKDPATGKKSNISITESLWAQHAAHGDTKGNCPVDEKTITICHNIPGQPGKTQTINIPESKWNIHKSHGDKIGPCPKPVNYIQICHKSGNTSTNMTIKENEWAQHAAHGDTKGNCPVDEMISICHINQFTGKLESMKIAAKDWPFHQQHGDIKGSCKNMDTSPITICHQRKNKETPITKQIPAYLWPMHQAHGDTKGSCPTGGGTPKITICHYPPGNTDNPQTIEIPQSAWPAHQAHGDTQGGCDNTQFAITICLNNKELTINPSQWSSYEAQGAIKGKCPTNSNIEQPKGVKKDGNNIKNKKK